LGASCADVPAIRPVRRTRTRGLMPGLLVTDGLTKRYGGLMANDGVAVTLEAGEIRGLIGPNGAGKTTFVNVITGIEHPDSGSVALDRTPRTGPAPSVIRAPR